MSKLFRGETEKTFHINFHRVSVLRMRKYFCMFKLFFSEGGNSFFWKTFSVFGSFHPLNLNLIFIIKFSVCRISCSCSARRKKWATKLFTSHFHFFLLCDRNYCKTRVSHPQKTITTNVRCRVSAALHRLDFGVVETTLTFDIVAISPRKAKRQHEKLTTIRYSHRNTIQVSTCMNINFMYFNCHRMEHHILFRLLAPSFLLSFIFSCSCPLFDFFSFEIMNKLCEMSIKKFLLCVTVGRVLYKSWNKMLTLESAECWRAKRSSTVEPTTNNIIF